ncbi:class I SAM-dependent methyltransferase [Candidatus Peregrinibacteria bacterium]|nr:class I SAM-dependent methyltransferase [Candidatus Peregrinibacteria bacterium]MBI3816648.1 class I SAM-dependent methyltransferase [Candidatus Peregrinibacteria bacterium]
MQFAQFSVHAEIEEKHWWFLGRRAIVAALIGEILPASKRTLIVDVGCGTGGMTHFLSQRYSCIGVDPSADAITFAKTRFPELRFIQGNAPDDVRGMMEKADLVLLQDVLEHVEHDRLFIENLIASMKPGAFFLTIAPADPSLWGPHDAGFEHFRRYEDATFRALWSGLPVRELLISHCNSRLHPLVRFLRTVSRWRGAAWGPASTDLATPAAPLNAMLRSIFGGEAGPLLRALRRGGRTPYRRGVSLLALLQTLPVRQRRNESEN